MSAGDSNCAFLQVRVTPRSSKSEVIKFENGVLHVRVCSPPVDGAANQAIIELLSRAFGTRKSAIMIHSGDRSRLKRVRFAGIDDGELILLLSRIASEK